jgi:hypothetical protein
VRRARAVPALYTLCALAAATCSPGSTGPDPTRGLAATAGAGAIRLTNRAARPAFTFVVGRAQSALIDWTPCVEAAECPPIAAGEMRRVPYPGGHIEPGEQEALVYWWHVTADPVGAPRPDSIRVIVVRLAPRFPTARAPVTSR